jgi:hypothetical protein
MVHWVEFKFNVTIGRVLIVKKGVNIIGRDLLKALQINIDGRTMTCYAVSAVTQVSYVNTVSEPVNVHRCNSEYGHMFKESDDQVLSNVKGFCHRVKVNSNVTPIQQKLRRLPFAVLDKVSHELKKLLRKLTLLSGYLL